LSGGVLHDKRRQLRTPRRAGLPRSGGRRHEQSGRACACAELRGDPSGGRDAARRSACANRDRTAALTATIAPSSPHLNDPPAWSRGVDRGNDGVATARVATATMLGPVSFEVVDEAGARVPLGPPPLPPQDLGAGIETIEPGASLTLHFHGDELFPDAPAPRRYRGRLAAQAPAVGDAWRGLLAAPS